MKKWLVVIVLLLGIAIVLQEFIGKDYSFAKTLADNGKYKEFYTEIEYDLKNGDEDAKKILIEYFLRAVKNSNTEATEYYLKQDTDLINISSDSGYRAIDMALSDDLIRLEILKILIQYEPNFDYIIEYYPDEITPLQLLVIKKESFKSLEAIRLFINAGANVNFYSENGTSSTSPILFSYLNDNINVFNILIKNNAELKNSTLIKKENKNDVLSYIAGSYALELINNKVDLKLLYEKPIGIKVKRVINSHAYQVLNKRNIEYLSLISIAKKFTSSGYYGMNKLAQFFAVTNETKGLNLLVKNGLCHRELICKKLKEIAFKNNNRAVLNILNNGEK